MGSQHHLYCFFCKSTPTVNYNMDTGITTVDCDVCGSSFGREEYMRLYNEGAML